MLRFAVVAAACEYPESNATAELWKTVVSGRRCFRPLPPQRLSLAEYAGDGPDSIYPLEAALLEGYSFDRVGFNVPISVFERTDLSHWLALDVASRAWAQLDVQPFTATADETA